MNDTTSARETIENLWDRAIPVLPLLDAHRAEVLIEAANALREMHFTDGMSVQEIGTAFRHMAAAATDRANTNPVPTAAPGFFQPGQVYTRVHHGRTVEFHVVHIATAPDCGFPTAFGWRKDPEINGLLPMDSDDTDGWTAA